MELLDLMKSRYSARSYASTKIKKEKLELILEAGRVAPTGANRQTQRILVIESEAGLEKVAKATRSFNPPMVLMVMSEVKDTWKSPYDGKEMNDIDCSIVSTHMMLMAKSLGIDSVWLNWFDPKVLRSEFNIPDGFEINNLLVLGYSDKEPLDKDRHNETRKQLSETVFYEKF